MNCIQTKGKKKINQILRLTQKTKFNSTESSNGKQNKNWTKYIENCIPYLRKYTLSD